MNAMLVVLTGLMLCSFAANANDTSFVTETNLPASSDFDRYSREIRDACKWGSSTNGLQLGVGIWGLKPFTVQTYLMTTNSKGLAGPAPAPHGYRLGLSLQDANQKPVTKIKAGDAICQPVGWFMRRSMHIEMVHGAFFLTPGVPRRYDDTFNLLDCFKVEKPGTYTLFVTGAIYRRTAPSPAEVIPMDLLPVSIQLSITQADLDRYKASKEK